MTMNTRNPIPRQHGAALVVSLMMLVVLTLLAVSSINMSTVNLRIVNNMRTQMETETAIHFAMDQIRSSMQPFGGLANADPATPQNIVVNGHNIVISARTCIASQVVQGNELTIQQGSASHEDTFWEYTGSYTDPATGATTRQHQGITTTMPGGNC